ncbi:lmo0937 family membrane protein [Myroides sp. LJL119]
MKDIFWTLVFILLIGWVVGFFGFAQVVGGAIHILLVLLVILVVIRLIQAIGDKKQ